VEGSGQTATIVSAEGSLGVVQPSSNSALRDMKIVAYGAIPEVRGLYATGSDFDAREITISVSGATSINSGVYAVSTAARLFHVSISIDSTSYSYGIYANGSNLAVQDSAIYIASDSSGFARGVFVTSGDVTLLGSQVAVEGSSIGTLDATFADSASNMVADHSTLIVGGGDTNSALHTQAASASATVRNSALTAIGATTTNRGLYNEFGSATMLNSNITVTAVTTSADEGLNAGGTLNVRNSSVTATAAGSTATALNATGSAFIDSSELIATTYGINAQSGSTVRVGGSKVSGATFTSTGAGSKLCVSSFSGVYAALTSSCI
jgi:hypothetical protein